MLDVGFYEEGHSSGVYHSRYDTFEHHSRFVDPGFVYDAMLAKTVGRIVLRVADADLPVQNASAFADAVSDYLDQVKKLADDEREEAETQAKLLHDHRSSSPPIRPSPAAFLPHSTASRISSLRSWKTQSIA